MDNAIEACERMKGKDKWIKIYMKSSYQLLFIKIENSMEGEVKKQGDHFLSVKSKNDFHGYGLKSVHYIVSQYGGGHNLPGPRRDFLRKNFNFFKKGGL